MVEIQEAEAQQAASVARCCRRAVFFARHADASDVPRTDLGKKSIACASSAKCGHWEAGELLFETGHIGPGMFVVLAGRVKIYQRDGLGRERLVSEHGARAFLAEVGQLSGRPASSTAWPLDPVDALLIPPTGCARCSSPKPNSASASCAR